MGLETIVLRLAPAVLALILSSVPAFGAEETKPAETSPQPLPHIASIRFVGNEHFSSRSLKRDLETKARKPVDLKVLSADVDQIVKRYEDDGYLDAKVNLTSEPLEGTTDQELLFTIIEGPRFKLKKLEITGNTVFPTEELRALVHPEKDGYFSKGAFVEGGRRIWEHYGQVGRMTTEVKSQMAPPAAIAGPDALTALGPRAPADEATVRYVITEGPPVTLQEISIEWVNTPITQEWLVRRELERKLYEGMALTLEPVEDVIGRLRTHRWFKSVQYRFKTGATPDQAILVVSLEEGWTSRVSLRGGAMTYSGLSAALEFQESNFDLTVPPHSWKDIMDWNMFRGRGEQLSLTAAPGQRFTVFGASFEQPHTFETDNSFLASGTYSHEQLPDFSLWQAQVRVGLERELADHWWASAGPTVLATDLWNLNRHDVPDYNEATGYTPGYGAWGRLTYTTTPDTPIVNRGVRASLLVEPLYEDVGFLRTTLSAARFFPLHGEGFDAQVLEVSGQAGQILGNAPVFDRFFCGGLGSVRGFDVWGISPLYNGDPIGGFYFATARTQYEFPIWRPISDVYLRGVLFVDTGDAETRLGDMGRIRVGSGFGLRAVLPKFNGMSAGINFAWPLNSYHGDDTQVFTFFMGLGL